MKCKKIAALLLLVCSLSLFAGCKADLQEITWSKYADMPFMELLEEGMEAQLGKKVTVTVNNGWNNTDGIAKDDIDAAEETYTYIATIVSPTENMPYTTYEFYMAVEGRNLEIKGMRALGKDGVEDQFVKKEEALTVLDGLVAGL